MCGRYLANWSGEESKYNQMTDQHLCAAAKNLICIQYDKQISNDWGEKQEIIHASFNWRSLRESELRYDGLNVHVYDPSPHNIWYLFSSKNCPLLYSLSPPPCIRLSRLKGRVFCLLPPDVFDEMSYLLWYCICMTMAWSI